MKLPKRIVASLALLVTLAVSGICEVRTVIPQELGDEAENPFLWKLVDYLEAVSDFGDTDLNIEILGKLPSVGKGIDFYLIETDDQSFDVLYRSRDAASYKKAALVVTDESRNSKIETVESPEGPSKATGPFRIEKGQAVNILFSKGPIRLGMEGEAMQAGVQNEWIRVKVQDTGKEFIGTVAGPLEVHVDQ